MKRLLFAIILLFFVIVSCSKSKPRGILSVGKMSDLMTEVYAVDGYLNTLPLDSSRKLLPVLYGNIFDRFKIDSVEFAHNIDYYYGNPLELEKLSTNVKKTLSKYERNAQRTDSIQQVHVADSIKTVQRWRRLAQEMENLIQYVYLDTTKYEFNVNNQKFFTAIPLSLSRHDIRKPAPYYPVEADEPLVLADTVSTLDSAETTLDSLMKEEPVILMPIIDTTSVLPRIFQYQRFDVSKVSSRGEQSLIESAIDSVYKDPVLSLPIADSTWRMSRPVRLGDVELNRRRENLPL